MRGSTVLCPEYGEFTVRVSTVLCPEYEDEYRSLHHVVSLSLPSIESDSLDDGHKYTPSSIFSWLTMVMYNRRTRINPLWNTVVVGGYHDNKP